MGVLFPFHGRVPIRTMGTVLGVRTVQEGGC